MIRYDRLSDTITREVALNLHYQDNKRLIDSMGSADEVVREIDKAIDRYQNDSGFRAKVMSLVAGITAAVRENESAIIQPDS